MIKDLITKNESKTLEFKENTRSLTKIIQTVIAFANTAGGTIVIGVKDRNKEIVGIQNILEEEDRLASAIADSIEPLITPSLQLSSWRQRDLLVIHVPYSIGPYFLKAKGREGGTFIRFGSTNRLADRATIEAITRSKQHQFYDELPCYQASNEDMDFDLGKKLFSKVSKKLTPQNERSLELIVRHQNHELPSIGGILLFGKQEKRMEIFPNAMVRCARFKGKTKVKFIDQFDICEPLPLAVDIILEFIRKHSMAAYEIEAVRRKEVFQYPPQVVREAVINALVHADYSVKGSTIQIAIFDDRMEITNPGALPFGLSMKTALSGFSQLRNKVIGRIFQELNLIEHWGTGLGRMIEICQDQGILEPLFEEVDNYFKVTLFHGDKSLQTSEKWEEVLIEYLSRNDEVTAKQAQKIWDVTPRTTTTRLKKMKEKGLVVEMSTGPYDSHKTFIKPEKQPRNA
ncbi:putative DNA binding domain-containing protein [Chlamydiales bacterium]|nr:putative DNA binding domain-containing protein [Chlamydiales bacterium]